MSIQRVNTQCSCSFPDCNWHLRKTNWCGEADKLLDDPDLTLDASLVNDGDHILLEPGRLPPKVTRKVADIFTCLDGIILT